MTERRRIVLLGAAGHDVHLVFRDDMARGCAGEEMDTAGLSAQVDAFLERRFPSEAR